MGVAILAPVPSKIIRSAFDTQKAFGRVAFGSNNEKFFEGAKAQSEDDLPVLFYESTVDHVDDDVKRVFARGTFVGIWKEAGKSVYPNRDHRPRGADADTPWALYWLVEGLTELAAEDRVPLTHLSSNRTGQLLDPNFTPRTPILVKVPFL